MLSSIIHDPNWQDKITTYFNTGVTPVGTDQVEVHDADNTLFIYVDRDIAGEGDDGIWVVRRSGYSIITEFEWTTEHVQQGWTARFYPEYFGVTEG